MKIGILSLAAALLLALPAMAGPPQCHQTVFVDTDGDTVCDASDNCRLVSNTDQCDTDSDGYGNACDGDFNQDAAINGLDFLIFGPAFAPPGTSPPAPAATDMDCNGLINGLDFLLFGPTFAPPGAPGPSCLHPKGTACP